MTEDELHKLVDHYREKCLKLEKENAHLVALNEALASARIKDVMEKYTGVVEED